MADIPRDPRQLARDILAGKVRIEDLARERQMRQGGGGAGQGVPAKVPLPRAAPARPAVRPPAVPARPPQYPGAGRPVPAAPQRRVPAPVVQRPAASPVRPQYAAPPPQPVANIQPDSETPVVTTSAVPRRPIRLRELAKSRHALRQGIILAEVLGKPVALREEEG